MSQPKVNPSSPEQVDRYSTRKAMAWWSLRTIIATGVPLIYIAGLNTTFAANVGGLAFVIGGVYGSLTAVVLAYMGTASVTDIWGKR